MAKLSGRLPKGQANGLATLESVLVNDPTRNHVVLCIVDTARVVEDIDTGEREPHLRILRAERLLPEDAHRAEQLLRRALEHRTGEETLPLDLEDELTEIFRQASIDEATGETHYPEADEDPA